MLRSDQYELVNDILMEKESVFGMYIIYRANSELASLRKSINFFLRKLPLIKFYITEFNKDLLRNLASQKQKYMLHHTSFEEIVRVTRRRLSHDTTGSTF